MKMKSTKIVGAVLGAVLLMSPSAALAQSTGSAFTYQGQLKEGGMPADGAYDFRFTLYDDLGAVVSGPIPVEDHPVTNGLFSVILDFGASPFTGDARFLEIAVRPGDSGDVFTVLSPRQELTPTPYAATALETVGVDGHSLDASDGEPADAVFVASNGRVHMSHGGLEVYDEAGHGISFTSHRIAFDEFPSEDPIYDYSNTTDTHRFWTNGTRRMIVDSSGNVGIGTDSPAHQLHVAGDAGFNQDAWFYSEVPFEIAHYTNTGMLIDPGSLSLHLEVDNNTVMSVTDGAVGIGTSNPTAKLEVDGTVKTSGFQLGSSATTGYVLTTDANGAGTWQAPTGGGSTPWQIDGDDNIYYGDGNVGINMGASQTPLYPLHVAGMTMTNSLKLGDSATVGHVLTTDANGVGTWQQPTGGGSTPWQIDGEDNIYYGDGNVGIGMGAGQPPLYPLHVLGTVGMTSLKLGDSATPGHVLTADASGVGTWQEMTASQWEGAGGGGDIYYTGEVGIGTTNPQHQLHVVDDGSADQSATIKAVNNSTLGEVYGLLAEADSPDGRAVKGTANSATGDAAGVFGESLSSGGAGVYGKNVNGGYGVYGRGETAGGWAGYFWGRGYFSGNVGIGQVNPEAKLEVAGTVKMSGLQLGTSSTAGYVLTCDANGVGTWQESTGGGTFDLPYEGTVDAQDQAALSITNTGTTGGDTIGGWFESNSSTGKGVLGLASGTYATGVRGEATGSDGVGLYGYASGLTGIGLVARNESASQPALLARNYVGGPMIVAKNSATNTVFEVANDGTTSVNVLHIMGGADLAEKFDVCGQVEPGMVVEIDPENPGKLRIARGEYNRRVAGVVSGANELGVGMMLGELPGAENATPIALSGRVWVYCDASESAIEPGDMLTTAERPGHAMPVLDHSRANGAVIGKAMGRLAQGETGTVLVLVNLQ
jgi:hypothetical protein